MWNMIWPIAIVVAANTLYNICTKQTPADANAFFSLAVTYLAAAACSLGLYFAGAHDRVAVEVSRESGFASGLIDYRALCIADGKPIVPGAFVKVEVQAA